MLNATLGLSAAVVGVATLMLLVAGRWPIGGYVLRSALLVVLVLGVATALGLVDVRALRAAPPNPADPVSLVGAAVLVVALLTPRRWWAVGSITFASLVVATVLYAMYLVSVTVALTNGPLSFVLGLLLLGFQVVALSLMIASLFEMIDALCRPLETPPPPALPASPEDWPTVAFQLPVHQEPPELVLGTIRSLLALDYPPESLVIQVLDNNTTDELLWRPVEDECRRLREAGHRVQFVHLEDWPGFKAGALNYGTAHLPDDAAILAVLDADYLVQPGFLRTAVPYFEDPDVAFVQTPQEYREWESSAFYRACHTGFAYFFAVGMISRSYRNAIIFAGTMGLIRRAALDEVGGWDENIITEDAEASLRILARGYRGIYVPRPFGKGIMPLTYEGLRGQRFRWAFGGMQILRKHWRSLLPWSRSSLSQRQRRDYLLGGLGWFNDALTLGFALFVAATALGVLTRHPFVVQRLQGLGLVLPLLYIALGLIRYLWGLRVATGASLTEAAAAMRVNLSLSWIVTLALIRGSIEKRGVFLRTPKFQGPASVRSLRLVWVEVVLGLGALVLAVAVVVTTGLSGLTLTVGVLLAWSALIYGSAFEYAMGDPTRPPTALRDKAALELTEGTVGRALQRAPAVGAVTAALVGVLIVAGALAFESARPVVPGVSSGVPPGDISAIAPSPAPSVGASASPAAGASPSGLAPSASPGPSSGASPAATPVPATPAPSPPPTPAATPATPAPSPPPTPAATPAVTPAATPPPTPAPTPVPSTATSLTPAPAPALSAASSASAISVGPPGAIALASPPGPLDVPGSM